MSKILLPFVFAAALVTALWILIARRQTPDPTGKTGWRRAFALTVTLCILALGGWLGLRWKPAIPPLGRTSPLGEIPVGDPQILIWAVQQVHPNHEAPFLLALETMENKGRLRNKEVLRLLRMAYFQMAYHIRRPLQGTCYEGGDMMRGYRHNIIDRLKTVKSLEAVHPEVAAKAKIALARELMVLDTDHLNKENDGREYSESVWRRENELIRTTIQADQRGDLQPSPAALEAAEWLIAWASGQEQPRRVDAR
jgi:hypothetical protein